MELKPCPFCGKSVAHVDSVANHEMMDEYEFDYSWRYNHYDVVCDYRSGGCGHPLGKITQHQKMQSKHGTGGLTNDG